MRLANQFARLNSHISTEVVEANQFMDLANNYSVYGVPKIVIKGPLKTAEFEGAQPEPVFLQNILKVI